jgi:hypothetical protein
VTEAIGVVLLLGALVLLALLRFVMIFTGTWDILWTRASWRRGGLMSGFSSLPNPPVVAQEKRPRE